MLGAILGDIVGSRWEFQAYKSKLFPLFTSGKNDYTDDSVMTLAIAEALLTGAHGYALAQKTVALMQDYGRRYPGRGYGGRFVGWLVDDDPQPYNSFGNGSAMRVSACAYAAKTLEEAKDLSYIVTAVTHSHPEGIKGAEATTVAIWMALHGATKDEIRAEIEAHYYPLNFTLDEIRPSYRFNEICQDTVPQAIVSFLEAEDFEDTLRNAVSLGGDADTLAAIAGSIAEAYFGLPEQLRERGLSYLPDELASVVERFEAAYPQAKIVAAGDDQAKRV